MSNSQSPMKENIPHKKDKPLDWGENIKVHFPKDNTWKVEINIHFEEMSDENLAEILRAAKMKISRRNNIPVGLLTYKDLIKKEVKTEGYYIVANIIKGDAEKGEPTLRFLNSMSNGIEYRDMILYLDLYPLRESGEAVTLKDIEELLEKAELKKEQVNFKLLEESMRIVKKDLATLKNILLAQGHFPDPSEDSKITYFFTLRKKNDTLSKGSSKVESGQLLCQKTPALKGETAGYTIRGEKILPAEPRDFHLIAGKGTRISLDEQEIYAIESGIPYIRQEPTDNPSITNLIFSIEAINVMDGNQPVNIITESHIEIAGGLKSGSQVISQGEVIITGDVEKDTSIVASGDINVSGSIKGGSLISEKDITGEGEVSSAKLMAHGALNIKGTAIDCELVGYEVNIDKIIGCKVTAGLKVIVDTISEDERGFTAKITAGLINHLKEKIKENITFIEFARKNLTSFQKVVGEEIVQSATPANVSRMVIIHCTKFKNLSIQKMPKEQLKALKDLIESIGPIRDLMHQKSEDIKEYTHQIQHSQTDDQEIIVNNGAKSAFEVEIAGISEMISPFEGKMRLKKKGNKIISEKV